MHLVKINEVSIRHVGHVFKEFAEITVAPSCDYYYMPDYPWHRFCLRVVNYLPYRVSGSTLAAVGRSQLLARWPGTHSWILSGIQRAAQTVLGVYLKRTCSRVTSASSALAVRNALTHSSIARVVDIAGGRPHMRIVSTQGTVAGGVRNVPVPAVGRSLHCIAPWRSYYCYLLDRCRSVVVGVVD